MYHCHASPSPTPVTHIHTCWADRLVVYRRLGRGAAVFGTLVTTKLLTDTIVTIPKLGSIALPILAEYQTILDEIHRATHGASGESSAAD